MASPGMLAIWTDEASAMLWLEDFIPQVLPRARIMTFGDSRLLLSQSKRRIENFARNLLNRLWMLRQFTPDDSSWYLHR